MKSIIFKFVGIIIVMVLTTTFIFIGNTNFSKNNSSKKFTNNIESKVKIKQDDIQEETENQNELP